MKILPRLVLAVIVNIVLIGTANAFWSWTKLLNSFATHHQDFTADAIGGANTFYFQGQSYPFTPYAIEVINIANAEADAEGNYSRNDHFDSEAFNSGLLQIAQRRRQLNILFSKPPGQRSATDQATVWNLLGFMIHASQDFYAHSTWVELGNTANIVDFGTLTKIPTSPVVTGFFSSNQSPGDVCIPSGYPLLTPVLYVTSGYYGPALPQPANKCVHGSVPQAASTCVPIPGVYSPVVAGISKDSPCALYLQGPLRSHFIAKQLAEFETFALVQSIVADLDAANNSYGLCILLGRPSNAPPCNSTSVGVSAMPATVPTGGGPVTLTATVTVASTGAMVPEGAVTFVDQFGLTLCPATTVTPQGVATCPANIVVAPDTVTATFFDSTGNYPNSTGTVTVGGSNTCVPLPGQTSCTVVLYTPSNGLNGGELQTPITMMVTTVTSGSDYVNGPVTTTASAPMVVATWTDVAGSCDLVLNACPPLIPHNFSVCSVDGKFIPSSYSGTVTFYHSLPTGCTGTDKNGSIVSGYSLAADGTLTMTSHQTEASTYTCPNGGLPTYTITENDPIDYSLVMSLANGSGNASASATSLLDETGSITYNITANGNGSVTWPAETALPPRFVNTGMVVTTKKVAAGAALDAACVAAP